MQSKPHSTELIAQDYVRDKEDGGEAVVRSLVGEMAEDHFVPEIGGTVAAVNPSYSPKSDVALISFKGQLRAAYSDEWINWLASPCFEAHAARYRTNWKIPDADVYAYPADRLELAFRYDGDGDEPDELTDDETAEGVTHG